jgi:L-seryl-tRNA(Ser) seleniumtransferase
MVEIGGGFRMPDVMQQSGASLVEVGATNRTHLADYESAISDQTSLILHVHRSNFALLGFTGEPSLSELAKLSHQHGILLVDDIGSGALLDTAVYGLSPEPTLQASLDAGSDLVLFSGDKLIGGPQAGILIGRAEVIARLRQHPLYRALRPDKLCLAALGATLTHYLKGEAFEHIPIWCMISQSVDDLQDRARRYEETLAALGLDCSVVAGHSAVGGGSLPGETLPTWLVQITIPSAEWASEVLRSQPIPVITRIENDKLVLDPRTILARDEEHLLAAFGNLAQKVRGQLS